MTPTRSHPLSSRRRLPPSPPVGAIAQTLACALRPLALLDWCRAHCGPRFTVHPIDMPPLVFLSASEEIRSVLSAAPSTLHPGAGASMLMPLVSEQSFMLLDEHAHIPGRRVASRAFRRDCTSAHAQIVSELVEREVRTWPCGVPFALHPRLRSLTLAVAMRAAFAHETPQLRELRAMILRMLTVTADPTLALPRLRRLPGWRRRWKRFLRERLEVERRLLAMIAAARHNGARAEGFLALLLEAHNQDGSPMSDRQIHAHLMSLLIAGHETTASQLAWAFQLLAHHPEVQDRLFDDIDGGRDAGRYLKATVTEVLRHRPVFLFTIPRLVVTPIQIGEWRYEPPAQLLGCIYLMHHDPELYPAPHLFSPDRFLDGDPQARAWLPWGGGRKRCPGSHLATFEIETILRATLARRRVKPPAGARMEHARWRSVIVTPHAGSRVILQNRNS